MNLLNNMTDITNQLKTIFGERLKENEPIAKHLNYRIGGPARWFADAQSVEELKQAVEVANQNNVPFFALGGGSNTLASDEGFAGLVLKLAMRNVAVEGNTVVADAGAISASVARTTAGKGLAGLTWAISLPGTIGGAVRGNAGCFGGETKDYLTKVDVLRDGEVIQLSKDDLKMGYRESALKHSNDVVLRAYFDLPAGDAEELKKQLDETLAKRKSTQPLHAGSAGCIFKNYEIQSDEELERLKGVVNIPEAMQQSRRLSAGWIIDQMDLKGMRVGDAMISEEHGNFLINLGNATASDIVQLIAVVKTRVRDRLGIQLQEEIKYLGF